MNEEKGSRERQRACVCARENRNRQKPTRKNKSSISVKNYSIFIERQVSGCENMEQEKANSETRKKDGTARQKKWFFFLKRAKTERKNQTK